MIMIIGDSREKKWIWPLCSVGFEMRVEKLDTGDYSIEGYEDKITIDRKKSVSELAQNLGLKDFPRFQRELIRMKSFEEAYVLCEFSLDDLLRYPEGCPFAARQKKKIRVKGKGLLKHTEELEKAYNVKFIFASDRLNAILVARDIFLAFIKKHNIPYIPSESLV